MTDIHITRPSYAASKPLPALRSAADAYGVSLPSVVTNALTKQAEVTALLRSVPENGDYDLGRAVLAADDIEAAVEEAAKEQSRRDALRAMNRGNALANLAKEAVALTLSDAYGDLWSSVRKAVERDVATLVKQSEALPPNAALDPAAVLRHKGGAAAYAAVEPVLDRLSVLLDALPRPRSEVARTLPAPVSRVLWLVSVPETEPLTRVGPWEGDHSSPESQAQRESLHRFREAVEQDARTALVGVARGEFPGVTLDPAPDADAVVARARRFAIAQLIVTHKDGDRDSPHVL